MEKKNQKSATISAAKVDNYFITKDRSECWYIQSIM